MARPKREDTVSFNNNPPLEFKTPCYTIGNTGGSWKLFKVMANVDERQVESELEEIYEGDKSACVERLKIELAKNLF